MSGFSKCVRALSNDYGDDIGRGKNKVSKHKHKLRVRFRRLLKKQTIEENIN